MPFLASAQLTSGLTDVNSAFKFLSAFLTSASVIIFAAAFVYFFWGVLQYIRSGGEEEGKSEGRNKIVVGIIALAVMASVYGLVNFLTGTAKLSGTTVPVPAIPTLTL